MTVISDPAADTVLLMPGKWPLQLTSNCCTLLKPPLGAPTISKCYWSIVILPLLVSTTSPSNFSLGQNPVSFFYWRNLYYKLWYRLVFFAFPLNVQSFSLLFKRVIFLLDVLSVGYFYLLGNKLADYSLSRDDCLFYEYTVCVCVTAWKDIHVT